MSALSFLSKKSWHTGLQTNQKAVWEAEKAALDERRKLDELRKERDRERELQELERLHEESGGKRARRQERVDWMYSAPASGSQIDKSELEDYLLGKKRVDKLLQGDESQQVSRHGGAPGQDTARSAGTSAQSSSAAYSDRELASKIREDPMLAIRQQEQAAYQALLKDPARLRAMRKAAGMEDESSSRGESKEERRRRKEEKKRRREIDSRRSRYDERDEDRSYRSRDRVSHSQRTRDDDEEHIGHRREHERESDKRRRHHEPDERRGDRDRRYGHDRTHDHHEGRSNYRRDYRDRQHYDDEYHRARASRSPARHPPADVYRSSARRSPSPARNRRREDMRHYHSKVKENKDDDEERRQARLAAMQQNASDLTSERSSYLARVKAEEEANLAREEELREKVRQSRRSTSGNVGGGGGGFGMSDIQGAFLLEQQRALYGSGTTGSGNGAEQQMDLADRLRRGRDTLQRFTDD